MINLLREQLYHQQMCLTKDIHLTDDDVDDMTSVSASVHSTSCVSEAVLSDISAQVTDMKQTLEKTHQSQKQEMEENLSKVSMSVYVK